MRFDPKTKPKLGVSKMKVVRFRRNVNRINAKLPQINELEKKRFYKSSGKVIDGDIGYFYKIHFDDGPKAGTVHWFHITEIEPYKKPAEKKVRKAVKKNAV